MSNHSHDIEIGVTGENWLGRENTESILGLIRKSFASAQDEIKMTAYSLTNNREFFNILENTLARGIPVSVIANRFEKEEFDGVRKRLSVLSKKYKWFKVKNFVEKKDRSDLHAKIISIDHSSENPLAIVGSANLSSRAITRNHEIAVLLKGKPAETIGNLMDLLSSKSKLVFNQ